MTDISKFNRFCIGDTRHCGQACLRNSDLFLQNLLIERHHQHVVDVEQFSRVLEYANKIREVRLLVAFEEVFAQPEGPENEIHVFLVGIVECIKRVISRRFRRVGWIDHAQILQAAGSLDMRQKAMKKLPLALAVKDDHRHFARAEAPHHILRDDVFEKS